MKTVLIKVVAWLYFALRGRPIWESQAYNPEKIAIIGETIFTNVAITLTLVLIVLVTIAKKKRWLSQVILLVTLLELFLFSRGNLISFPSEIVQQPREITDWLASQPGHWRYLSTSGTMPYTGLGVYWTHLRAREPFSPNQLTEEELQHFRRFRRELEALPENQGLSRRLPDAAGYAAAIPQIYLTFWSATPSSPNAVVLEDPAADKLDLLGVRYLVVGNPPLDRRLFADEKLTLAYEASGGSIYENRRALPRVFTSDEGAIQPAEILTYTPNRIRIRAAVTKPAQLILTDTYYPGWEAILNGEQVPIRSYQEAFRMIELPEGEHLVEWRYHPKSVRLGAIISLVTAIILILGWRNEKRLL